MRIVDHNWKITVDGIDGVNTWEDLISALKAHNINSQSSISFNGHAFPATVIGFQHLAFIAHLSFGNKTAKVLISTAGSQMLTDLNNPTIAFEVALDHISPVGNGDYRISYIVPTPLQYANQVSVLSCL